MCSSDGSVVTFVLPGSSTDISEDWEKDFDLDMTEEEVQLALSKVEVSGEVSQGEVAAPRNPRQLLGVMLPELCPHWLLLGDRNTSEQGTELLSLGSAASPVLELRLSSTSRRDVAAQSSWPEASPRRDLLFGDRGLAWDLTLGLSGVGWSREWLFECGSSPRETEQTNPRWEGVGG